MILCDANVLVALIDERDELHRLARRDQRELASKGLSVTHRVLNETFFLLASAQLQNKFCNFLQEFPISIQTEQVPESIFDDTIHWMRKYADHSPDWADAHLAVLCSRDASLQIWSYDSEFRTIWRLIDGRPIPLVGTRQKR